MARVTAMLPAWALVLVPLYAGVALLLYRQGERRRLLSDFECI